MIHRHIVEPAALLLDAPQAEGDPLDVNCRIPSILSTIFHVILPQGGDLGYGLLGRLVEGDEPGVGADHAGDGHGHVPVEEADPLVVDVELHALIVDGLIDSGVHVPAHLLVGKGGGAAVEGAHEYQAPLGKPLRQGGHGRIAAAFLKVGVGHQRRAVAYAVFVASDFLHKGGGLLDGLLPGHLHPIGRVQRLLMVHPDIPAAGFEIGGQGVLHAGSCVQRPMFPVHPGLHVHAGVQLSLLIQAIILLAVVDC